MVFDVGDPSLNTLVLWQNGDPVANDGGVYRTTNALDVASAVAFTQRLMSTAPDRSNARGVFAAYQTNLGNVVMYLASGEPPGGACQTAGTAGVLRVSTNGGASWSAPLAGGRGFCGGQCFYNFGLVASQGVLPLTPNDDVILLGGNVRGDTGCERLNARSTDGGASFTNQDVNLHPDTHAIKSAPSNPSIVYHGNDGGIFKSIDGGQTWASVNTGDFKATQYQSIAVHPTDPSFTIGGTQDNGTILRRPDGSYVRADFGDGGFSAIDQNATDTNAVTMYHTYFNQTDNLIGYARVTSVSAASDGNWDFFGCDAGDPAKHPVGNGITCSDNVEFYAPLVLGPGIPNTVYVGSDRLYRSPDRGVSNVVVSQVFGSTISVIGISRTDDNVRLVGLRDGGLFYTSTGALTLANLDPGNTIPDKYVARIVVDPADKTTAFITLAGYTGGTSPSLSHVWKITHLDTTPVLTPINGGLPDVPVNGFVVDPVSSAHLFAGTDVGVYESTNGGDTWSPYGVGLPALPVFDMAIPPGSNVLRIATHGRGLWQIAVPSPTLTVTKAGNGGGAVTSSPPGITCGSDCTQSYVLGTQVTLTATPDAGVLFAGWSGACGGTGPCTLTMDDAKAVTATFNLPTFPLTVTLAGNGTGTVTSSPSGIGCGSDCAENYTVGTHVSLTATPASGSLFAGWSGACSGTGPCAVTVDQAKAVTATFLPAATLTVTLTGSGIGAVGSVPPGINCGDDCTETYAAGTQVTLTAATASGTLFDGWGGACSGTGPCVVTLDSSQSVTASFSLSGLSLTVLRGGNGAGSVSSAPAGITCGVDCTESYANGAQVSLTATPAAGSTFAGWAGDCAGTGPCQVALTGPKTVIALFEPLSVGVNVGRQSGAPTLVVTLTARGGCGAIDHIQFGTVNVPFDNAQVTVSSGTGAPQIHTTGFVYTPPPGTTSIVLTVQRVQQSGGATVSPILFFDGCGQWQTFVGGGPDAFR